ncbi:unnamed protein product, partial [Rhizoctonia solani]
MEDELRPLPEHEYPNNMQHWAHSVMPPRWSGTYDSRTDPPGPGWHSPPPTQTCYSQQDAFGAHAYIEPRAPPMPPVPMPPPVPSWAPGYLLPPQYDPPPPVGSYGQYPPGPSGPAFNSTIFKTDPYGHHSGMPASPPDPSRPDVQITYTDGWTTKLTQYIRRRCFKCRVTEPPVWRKSVRNPGKVLCNKCGLYERLHSDKTPDPSTPDVQPTYSDGSATKRTQSLRSRSPSQHDLRHRQTPVGRERRQARTVAKRQRSIGADSQELPTQATLDTTGQRMLTSSITRSASDQPNVRVIGHTMPLVTIIEYLVNQGCADVSSQLKNIDEHSKYSGSLSDVYQARWADGSLVAVKCLRALGNSDVPHGKLLKNTARELYTWSRASHPNILKLHGLAMVRAYLVLQVHGDIKGNNVVLSEDGTPKLTDFGSTTMVQEFAIAFTATQTVNYSARWAAPELFKSQSPRFESDVYAFAKTVLEALTGDIPHKELRSDLAITLHVGLGGKLPIRPVDHIPPQSKKGDGLWDMLARCWDVEPTERPMIGEVYEF